MVLTNMNLQKFCPYRRQSAVDECRFVSGDKSSGRMFSIRLPVSRHGTGGVRGVAWNKEHLDGFWCSAKRKNQSELLWGLTHFTHNVGLTPLYGWGGPVDTLFVLFSTERNCFLLIKRSVWKIQVTWNRIWAGRFLVACHATSCIYVSTSTEGRNYFSCDLWHQHQIFILLCTNSIVSISVFTTKRITVSNMMKALIHPVARALWRPSISSHNWCCSVVFLSRMPVAGDRSGSTGAPHTGLVQCWPKSMSEW